MNSRIRIQHAVKKHGKAVTWSSVVLSILGLIGGLLAQHVQSNDGRTALWEAHVSDLKRIEALEEQAAYERGIRDEQKIINEIYQRQGTKSK